MIALVIASDAIRVFHDALAHATMESALSDSYLRFLADDEWDLVIGHLRSFRAAPSFRGCWPGWVFKTGKLGLGYYIDKQPVELALMKLAATSHATRRRVLPNLNTLARQKLLEAVETAPPVSCKIGRHLLETALRDLRKERGGLSCNSACLSLLADEAFVTEALTQGLQKVWFRHDGLCTLEPHPGHAICPSGRGLVRARLAAQKSI